MNIGPDSKHPNWEVDESDEAYTAMRRGCFTKGWEEFARFLYSANKNHAAELESLRQENQKLKGQLETVVKGSFDASAVMAKENAHLRERMNQLTSDYEGTIKRLREALEKIGWLPQDKAYGSSFPEIARKALNPPKKS